MFSVLDMPEHTTLEKAREAIRFGGINLDEVVRYLEGGSISDRLAQAEYYQDMARRAKVRKVLENGALVLLALAGVAFVAYQISGSTS